MMLALKKDNSEINHSRVSLEWAVFVFNFIIFCWAVAASLVADETTKIKDHARLVFTFKLSH